MSSALSFVAGLRPSRRSQRLVLALKADLAATNQELQTAQKQFASSSAVAGIGFWELDFATGRLVVSEQLASLTGETPAQWRSWSDFVERIHPEDQKNQPLLPLDTAPGIVNESLFRLCHSNGTYRHVRARSGTVGDAGAATGMVGALIHTSADQLLHPEEDLLETREGVQEFIRLADHDLRSPVRAITSLIEFIKEDLGPGVTDSVRDDLARIEDRTRRMTRHLDGIAELARAGDKGSTTELIDPQALIDDVVHDLEQRHCQIATEYSGPNILTWGAPLANCLRHLIDNASKHHDGQTGLVTVKACVVDDCLELVVIDDGPGIPAKFQAQVFEPLRRLQSQDEVEGSGMGLAVVAKTVKVHGGSLRLKSEVGVGTEVHIRWPIVAEP